MSPSVRPVVSCRQSPMRRKAASTAKASCTRSWILSKGAFGSEMQDAPHCIKNLFSALARIVPDLRFRHSTPIMQMESLRPQRKKDMRCRAPRFLEEADCSGSGMPGGRRMPDGAPASFPHHPKPRPAAGAYPQIPSGGRGLPSHPAQLLTASHWLGMINREKPVMLTSRNIGVRGGSRLGCRNSTSKL
jgi:hypothetical protein